MNEFKALTNVLPSSIERVETAASANALTFPSPDSTFRIKEVSPGSFCRCRLWTWESQSRSYWRGLLNSNGLTICPPRAETIPRDDIYRGIFASVIQEFHDRRHRVAHRMFSQHPNIVEYFKRAPFTLQRHFWALGLDMHMIRIRPLLRWQLWGLSLRII